MVCLGSRGMRRGFGKSGIGFQGVMEDLHVPPFLVGRGDCVPVGVQIATDEIQSSDATVLVFKDLAHQLDRKREFFEPAGEGSLFCPG